MTTNEKYSALKAYFNSFNCKSYNWITASGNAILISRMKDNHLINVINSVHNRKLGLIATALSYPIIKNQCEANKAAADEMILRLLTEYLRREFVKLEEVFLKHLKEYDNHHEMLLNVEKRKGIEKEIKDFKILKNLALEDIASFYDTYVIVENNEITLAVNRGCLESVNTENNLNDNE